MTATNRHICQPRADLVARLWRFSGAVSLLWRVCAVLACAALLVCGCRTYEPGAVTYELNRCNVHIGASTNVVQTTHGGVDDPRLTIPAGILP